MDVFTKSCCGSDSSFVGLLVMAAVDSTALVVAAAATGSPVMVVVSCCLNLSKSLDWERSWRRAGRSACILRGSSTSTTFFLELVCCGVAGSAERPNVDVEFLKGDTESCESKSRLVDDFFASLLLAFMLFMFDGARLAPLGLMELGLEAAMGAAGLAASEVVFGFGFEVEPDLFEWSFLYFLTQNEF